MQNRNRFVAAALLAFSCGTVVAQTHPAPPQQRQSTMQVSAVVLPYCFELMQADPALASALHGKGLLCPDTKHTGRPVSLLVKGANLKSNESGTPNVWRRLL